MKLGRDMIRMLMKASGILLLVIAVALGVTGMLLAKRPAIYSSTALLKIERDKIDLPELTALPGLASVANAGMDNTYFIETEIAVIKSDATLNRVITQLDLSRVWGQRFNQEQPLTPSETSELLKERLQVQPGIEVGLISIKAASEVAAEAAEIANATFQAYCEYRVDYRRRLAQTALNAIAEKYADAEKQIATARGKVEQAWQRLSRRCKRRRPPTKPRAGGRHCRACAGGIRNRCCVIWRRQTSSPVFN